MQVKKLFRIGGLIESIDGRSPFLDHDNCKIINVTKKDDALVLSLKREGDGQEGRAYLRVRDQYKNSSQQLLRWAFSDRIVGLTLNQLNDLETSFSIEQAHGKQQLVND